MSTTDTRAAFEKRFGPNDLFTWRYKNGNYRVASLQSAWEVWQAATEAAKATGTAGEPIAWHVTYGDGDLEHFTSEREAKAQVRDLEENGWLNVKLRPLVYSKTAGQPAPVVAVKTWQERVTPEFHRYFALHGYGPAEGAMMQEIADLRAALSARSQP